MRQGPGFMFKGASPPILAGHLAAILLAAAPAMAAPADEAPVTPVSPVTVFSAKDPPAVTSSFPAADASIAAGVLVLKLTFNQPMKPDSWSFAKGAGGEYPQCLDRPRLLHDERTFVLLCTTAPGAHYSIQLNGAATGGFANIGGRAANPLELKFSTTDALAIVSLEEAMKVEALKADEGPIMDNQAAAAAPAPTVR
jgi:hypothetical protein